MRKYEIYNDHIEVEGLGNLYEYDQVVLDDLEIEKYVLRKNCCKDVSGQILFDQWHLEPADYEYQTEVYKTLGIHKPIGNHAICEKFIDQIKSIIYTEGRVKWNLE